MFSICDISNEYRQSALLLFHSFTGGEKVQKFCKNVDMDSAYQEYAGLVYRFLYSYTHDAEWSQELMQETFLRAVVSITRYDGSCKLSTWLCQIAKHILYQELRKKKHKRSQGAFGNM